jgi:hypothetical protein
MQQPLRDGSSAALRGRARQQRDHRRGERRLSPPFFLSEQSGELPQLTQAMCDQFASAWRIRIAAERANPTMCAWHGRCLLAAQRGITPGDIDMTRIFTLVGLLTMFAISAACSGKTDEPGSDSTSGGERKLKKAGRDADEAVEEAGEDVSEAVDEATDK